MSNKVNVKNVRAQIKTFGTSAKKMQNKANDLLIASIECMAQHDDTDTLTMLYKALPSSVRKKAFKQVVEDLLPVKLRKNDKGDTMFRFNRVFNGVKKEGATGDTSYAPFYAEAIAELSKTPWYEQAGTGEVTEKEVKAMFKNVAGAEKAFVKLYEKLANTVNNKDNNGIETEEAAKLQAMYDKLAPAMQQFIN